MSQLSDQSVRFHIYFVFFLIVPATTEIYTLSLHDALPIFHVELRQLGDAQHFVPRYAHAPSPSQSRSSPRSEEHTSELQSHSDLVCRLLLEKKNTYTTKPLLQILSSLRFLPS